MIQTEMVPLLETERLLLRGHEATDFPACAAMWADESVVKYISGVPSSQEQSWSRLLRYAGHWYHLGFGYWAVVRKEDGAFLGEVGFADYRRDTQPTLNGVPEAGWVLDACFHGRGYATEAVAATLGWADEHLDFSSTVAMFDPSHVSSINVARKVGYTKDIAGRYGESEVLFIERARMKRN